MNGTKLPPLYTHTSSLFAQVFEPTNQPNQSSVIHETTSVIQTPDLVSHATEPSPERVSHDLTQPDRVIQNEANDQQKPCSTRPDPARDTNSKPCITRYISPGNTPKTGRRHFPIATRLQMRKDWIHGLGTIAKLALKYDIPLGTAQGWHKHDGWTSARNRWRAKQMEDDFILQPVQQPQATTPAKSPLLSRIEAQLEALDNFLDNANSPEDWQKLTNAKDKLLQNYYVLAGIAKPAARKASRTTPQRVQPIEPVEPGTP